MKIRGGGAFVKTALGFDSSVYVRGGSFAPGCPGPAPRPTANLPLPDGRSGAPAPYDLDVWLIIAASTKTRGRKIWGLVAHQCFQRREPAGHDVDVLEPLVWGDRLLTAAGHLDRGPSTLRHSGCP